MPTPANAIRALQPLLPTQKLFGWIVTPLNLYQPSRAQSLYGRKKCLLPQFALTRQYISSKFHEFCELLIANPNRLIRIFPNGKDQQVDTTADVLLADIKEELDLVE